MASPNTPNSINYSLARQLGFELSEKDFADVYNYAKLVQQEYQKIPCSPTQISTRNSQPSFSSSSVSRLGQDSCQHSEDLWIKHLRECFDSARSGVDTPFYNSIKARELQAQNEIRKRRIETQSKPIDLPSTAIDTIIEKISLPDSTQIVQKFCIPITVHDIKTLRSPNWLNDEVINFYFELLAERSVNNSNYPRLHIFNTFFYPKLQSNGYDSVKRWTRKVDLFSLDMILIPIHLGIHWCCAEINFKTSSIIYYDSLHNRNEKCLKTLLNYLVEEHMDKKGSDGSSTFNFDGWTLSCPKGIPCQQNGYDCGVFTCVFAENRSRESDFCFSQKQMKYYRDRISFEIITAKLLQS